MYLELAGSSLGFVELLVLEVSQFLGVKIPTAKRRVYSGV